MVMAYPSRNRPWERANVTLAQLERGWEAKSEGKVVLSPAFDFGPEFGHRTESRAAAYKHVNLLFQSIGIIGGGADVFDMLPELLEPMPSVIEEKTTVAGGAPRAP